jgi:hypothetical protein
MIEAGSLWDHFDRIVDFAIVLAPVAYFFFRWTKRIDSMFQVTKDITKVHLPFIYERLAVHDEKLDISHPDHPNIVFVANGSK